MNNALEELVRISKYYGNNPEYVIAGGGNTSFKNNNHLWIKASGNSLATITEEGFAKMDRHCLNRIAEKSYSSDPLKREAEIKEELHLCIAGSTDKRPSVETSLHNLLESAFVVHTHPTLVNALMCAVNSRKETNLLFGNEALFVEYTDPGYVLFKLVEQRISEYKKAFGKEPAIIFLENHGVFVSAHTCEEINRHYENISEKLNTRISSPLPSTELQYADLEDYIEELSYASGTTAKGFYSRLISYFVTDIQAFSRVNKAFTPDNIVYCKARYMFCESEPNLIYKEYLEFEKEHGFPPRIIGVKNRGIICLEESEKSVNTVYEVYLDLLKIAWLAEHFGGGKTMTDEQITFIDNWEVENYRRKIAKKG
ncbi:MAG: class II aldolase [Bacteroidales bacterium]|nr:class II aldolase [Bacteroidales bacterium]